MHLKYLDLVLWNALPHIEVGSNCINLAIIIKTIENLGQYLTCCNHNNKNVEHPI